MKVGNTINWCILVIWVCLNSQTLHSLIIYFPPLSCNSLLPPFFYAGVILQYARTITLASGPDVENENSKFTVREVLNKAPNPATGEILSADGSLQGNMIFNVIGNIFHKYKISIFIQLDIAN